jgi:hypothetical protein
VTDPIGGPSRPAAAGGVARCAGPGCGRPLARKATGRPPKFCSGNCNKAAQRARARAAEAERARAAQLAVARAAADRLRRPLEEAGFRTVAEAAALVVSCAADQDRPRAELDQAVTRLLGAAGDLAGIAREFRAAADLAARLSPAV